MDDDNTIVDNGSCDCPDIDLSSVTLSLDTIQQTLLTTNENLYYIQHIMIVLLSIQSAILALLAGSLIIIMVAVWRRS